MTHTTATRALLIANGSGIVFGAIMVLSVLLGSPAPMNFALDLIYLPLDGAQHLSDGPTSLLTAVSGGIMLGFCVMGWLVTHHIYRRDPSLGGRIIGVSFFTWYVSDSAGSIAAGAWFNVPFNSLFLALFLVPLAMNRSTRQQTATTKA
ncbi:hypothetical protein [Cognatishimia maritima]|uniref:Uncharacterized protein n=1 Tax=Cognatishimia maritima TaxID=870908 RepID=A0A1M5JF17_9RHOB|nr:hypothetical protein [Cognatishimia maritima]SHG38623.1 hypothetical protein SAMN04488044_0623 [Cognatishimia maritima]